VNNVKQVTKKNYGQELQHRSNIHTEKVRNRWSTKRVEAAAIEIGNTKHEGKIIQK
jgi:hypothetical protein